MAGKSRFKKYDCEKILENSPAGIYAYDVEAGKNIYVNPRYADLTGYSQQELENIGSKTKKLIHPDDREDFLKHFGRASGLRDGQHLKLQYRFRRKDSEYIWLLSHESVLERNPSGKPKTIMGSLLDITSQKKNRSPPDRERKHIKPFAADSSSGGLGDGSRVGPADLVGRDLPDIRLYSRRDNAGLQDIHRSRASNGQETRRRLI